MSYATVGLHNAKSEINIGAVLRLAGNFDVSAVFYQGKRYRKARTDVARIHKQIPLIQVDDFRKAIPFDCVPVAVDLVEGARDIRTIEHPKQALYIFGAEDATLGKEILSFCPIKIYIPTNSCMNLAMAVTCVLYDRRMKELKT